MGAVRHSRTKTSAEGIEGFGWRYLLREHHALIRVSLLTLILLAKASSSLIYARTLGYQGGHWTFSGYWYVTCLVMLAGYLGPYTFNGLVHPLGELPVLLFVESTEKA